MQNFPRGVAWRNHAWNHSWQEGRRRNFSVQLLPDSCFRWPVFTIFWVNSPVLPSWVNWHLQWPHEMSGFTFFSVVYHSSPEWWKSQILSLSLMELNAQRWTWHSQGKGPVSPQGWHQWSTRQMRLTEADTFPNTYETFRKSASSTQLNRISKVKATKKEPSPLTYDSI